jgi:hypothetical protein
MELLQNFCFVHLVDAKGQQVLSLSTLTACTDCRGQIREREGGVEDYKQANWGGELGGIGSRDLCEDLVGGEGIGDFE